MVMRCAECCERKGGDIARTERDYSPLRLGRKCGACGRGRWIPPPAPEARHGSANPAAAALGDGTGIRWSPAFA